MGRLVPRAHRLGLVRVYPGVIYERDLVHIPRCDMRLVLLRPSNKGFYRNS